MIPIIEYPANNARMGDFEQVITLLNAINTVTSNRVDGVEQFVQAILCLEGMQVQPEKDQSQADAETAFLNQVREVGGMMIPAGSKAYYLTQELNQEQTETLVQSMYNRVLAIVGIPNRNFSDRATSDTGSAVILRNGYSETEARARVRENYFRKSERCLLNLMITLCNALAGTDLVSSNVDIRFPRRNYTNDSANVTNLISMLSSDWITPEFAYAHSNMCADPHHEFLLAKKWHEEQESAEVEELETANVPSEMDTTSAIEA
jgi:SPP1 family phage portal protein